MPFMSTTDAITKSVADIGKFLKNWTGNADRRNWWRETCSLVAAAHYFSEKKEMKRCDMVPALRMKNSGPESAPRRLPWFNPVISTLPTPTNPPWVNPNGISKRKDSKPTPKKYENSHSNTYNPQRLNTVGSPRVDTEKIAPHKIHNDNSPGKTTPALRVEPATRPMAKTPQKRLTPWIFSSYPTYPQRSKWRYRDYNASWISALLATKSSLKHHVSTIEGKSCLNIFEA